MTDDKIMVAEAKMESLAELMEAGKSHYMAGEFALAVQDLKKATEAAPDSREAWRALGFALKENGDSPNAIGAFREVLRLKEDDADAHYGLGLVQDELGERLPCIASLERAIALRPNHSPAKAALVKALLKQGHLQVLASDKAGAEATFERAYKMQPGSAETVSPYFERLIDSNQFKKALDTVEAARKLSPNDHKLKELHEYITNDPRLARALRDYSLPGM